MRGERYIMKVNVLFYFGHDWIGKVIDAVEGPGKDPSHTGIFMFGGLLEAVKEGFVKSPATTYDGLDTKIITVDVPDMGAAETKALTLLGTTYGYIDCVNGGLHDLTGKNVPGDGEITANCSEAVCRILRAGGLDILPGVYADDITPADLLRALEPLAVAA